MHLQHGSSAPATAQIFSSLTEHLSGIENANLLAGACTEVPGLSLQALICSQGRRYTG